MFNLYLVSTCPPPENGTNTEPVPDLPTTYEEGDLFQYQCFNGMAPYFPNPEMGELNAICTEHGDWSITPPTCTGTQNLSKLAKSSDWFDN